MKVLSLVVALVVAATGATAALAHNAPSGAAKPGAASAVTFTVIEHAVSDTAIDTGAAGDTIGDVIAFGNPVYDKSDTAQVGRVQGSCVRTNPGQSYECEWTLIMPAGQIVVQGPFEDSRDSTMAITGGTGRYRTASGQMALHARSATSYEMRYTIYP